MKLLFFRFKVHETTIGLIKCRQLAIILSIMCGTFRFFATVHSQHATKGHLGMYDYESVEI
jgi:hypothetical protein